MQVYDLKPVSHITADAIGPPGQRVFYLQASQDDMVVTLVLEKEQVRALSLGVEHMLAELDQRFPQKAAEMELVNQHDLALREPVDPLFRVGQLGLGYDAESDLVIIVAQELTDDADSMSVARFWATRAQVKALSEQGMRVVEAGRPTCPLCGAPINPEGHFCPRRNGHKEG